jgi:hypothetical protein
MHLEIPSGTLHTRSTTHGKLGCYGGLMPPFVRTKAVIFFIAVGYVLQEHKINSPAMKDSLCIKKTNCASK